MTQTVDPQIERQGLWWVFHKHLMVEMFEWLRQRLGDEYLVDFDSQVLLIPYAPGPVRSLLPDVSVAALAPARVIAVPAGPEATPALLEVDEELTEVEQYSIHIRQRNQPDLLDPLGFQVVAVVELLSPSNKGQTGSADRRKFLAKRHSYLASPVSYTEIDLLMAGERDLPQPVEPLEAYPYMVWSSQVQTQARHYWGWGWETADPLPAITVPLDYPNVHTLDLAWCYQQAYVRNRWPLRLQGV
jgi:hypothetical protein